MYTFRTLFALYVSHDIHEKRMKIKKKEEKHEEKWQRKKRDIL